MNATVKRIVELMFQDVEMSAEVQAIYEEVLNNCQERFEDLTARGFDEDEAIAAVAESLKGMEDILSGYPRRQEAATHETENDCGRSFRSSNLRAVEVEVVSEDVTVEISDDDQVHVVYDVEQMPYLRVINESGLLRVALDKGSFEQKRGKRQMDAHFYTDDGDFNFASLGQMLGELLKNVGNGLRGSGPICIQIPEWNHLEQMSIHTTSGDVEIHGGSMDCLEIASTSGDVDVVLPEETLLRQLNIKTASGDVDVDCLAQRGSIQTMSGDVDLIGSVDDLNVSTISGDVEARAELRLVHFKSTSGDIELACYSEGIREITGSVTSGDVRIQLPRSIGPVEANLRSTTGDVRCRNGGELMGARVYVDVRSVSGDILVR